VLALVATLSSLLFIVALQIKYNDQVKVLAVNALDPSVVLSQLPTDTIINISVSATNNAGEGNFSNIITTKTLSKSEFMHTIHAYYVQLHGCTV